MKPKALVWVTLGVFLVVASITYFFSRSDLPESIPIVTNGQPTIGYPKARVQVVVFEEPKCISCVHVNENIFPKIKEQFIDTNKIHYTVIPITFLPNSMLAAIGLLCVYYANPLYPNSDLFFTYLDYLFKHQPNEHQDWVTTDKLIEFAHGASPAINLQKLRTCIDVESYRVKIEKNTEYGRNVMEGTISTPMVYVDGIEVKELTYDEISNLIKEVLESKGIYK